MALVLAVVWAWGIEREPGQGVPLADIWQRFPKFVFGYFVAFGALLAVGLLWPESVGTEKQPGALRRGLGESDVLRGLFFVMTF